MHFWHMQCRPIIGTAWQSRAWHAKNRGQNNTASAAAEILLLSLAIFLLHAVWASYLEEVIIPAAGTRPAAAAAVGQLDDGILVRLGLPLLLHQHIMQLGLQTQNTLITRSWDKHSSISHAFSYSKENHDLTDGRHPIACLHPRFRMMPCPAHDDSPCNARSGFSAP